MTPHITPSAARIAAVEALATELAGITADGRYIDASGQPGPVAPTERGEQSLATIAARKAAVAKRARLVPLLMAATDVWGAPVVDAYSWLIIDAAAGTARCLRCKKRHDVTFDGAPYVLNGKNLAEIKSAHANCAPTT